MAVAEVFSGSMESPSWCVLLRSFHGVWKYWHFVFWLRRICDVLLFGGGDNFLWCRRPKDLLVTKCYWLTNRTILREVEMSFSVPRQLLQCILLFELGWGGIGNKPVRWPRRNAPLASLRNTNKTYCTSHFEEVSSATQQQKSKILFFVVVVELWCDSRSFGTPRISFCKTHMWHFLTQQMKICEALFLPGEMDWLILWTVWMTGAMTGIKSAITQSHSKLGKHSHGSTKLCFTANKNSSSKRLHTLNHHWSSD